MCDLEREGVGNGDVLLIVSQEGHVVMYFEESVAVCPLQRKISNLSTGVMSLKFGIRVWNLGVERSALLSRPYSSCSEQTTSSLWAARCFSVSGHCAYAWSGSVSDLYP